MASSSTNQHHPRSMSAMGGGGGGGGGGREKTYFEMQREALIGEIAMSFEHVLANINKLNRSLEATVAVGNEFSSVEALWSQFENVMAKENEEGGKASGTGEGEAEGEEDHQGQGMKGHEGEGEPTPSAGKGEAQRS